MLPKRRKKKTRPDGNDLTAVFFIRTFGKRAKKEKRRELKSSSPNVGLTKASRKSVAQTI